MAADRRSSRRLMSQINVVPYIDVMLVLLVIFMITAPLINPGTIDLPEVGASLKPPVEPLEVTIKADGTLLLKDRSRGGQEQTVSRADLTSAVRQKQAQNPDQPVVIAADRNVRYEEVMKVLDLLHSQHVKRIGLLAKPRPGERP